jgi:superfamily II DNA helicase RecQ
VARLAPKVLNLNESDRSQLQQLINRHNTPQQLVVRAKIILLASEGRNHGEIARILDISLDMARLWRNRWFETSDKELSIFHRLQDLERIGAPVKFSMEQVIEVFALACSKPKQPPAWKDVRAAFQKIWGYEDFRPPQGEIIGCLLAEKDALIIMPTGGGKSICFQLPALLKTGLTLVVSPLVALMENQVQELRQRNLSAALLHSELPSSQRRAVLQALERQQLRLLYLSPETLLSAPVWERLCQPQLKINGLILDEAHCLVQWGDTFRPAYRRLGAVRPALLKFKAQGTHISVAAFTATADPLAQKTIKEALRLEQPAFFRVNPYRY